MADARDPSPLPVAHASHPAYGYLIEAGRQSGVAPELWEFPAWARRADLMFADAAALITPDHREEAYKKMRYRNRTDAGRQLADRLSQLDLRDPVVLALPRGGVPIGYEVARALSCPLDVLVVRKIGAPGEPEFGVGAVTADGPPSYDPASLATLGLREDDLEPVAEQERQEVDRREVRYRGGRTAPPVAGRSVIVVDDGVATGSTARAALRSMANRGPGRLIFAVPVCAGPSAEALAEEVDDLVCLQAPKEFFAVGQWYEEFGQLSDEDVTQLLRQAA